MTSKKVLLFLLFLFFTLNTTFANILGETVATVTLTKTEGISSLQAERRIEQVKAARQQAGLPPGEVDRQEVIDSLIAEILIRQAAERAGITVTENQIEQVIENQKKSVEAQVGQALTDRQFQQMVANQSGMNWRQFKESIRTNLIQQQYISSSKRNLFEAIKAPTEEEILERYEENITEITNPEYVRIRQIFIPLLNKNETEKAAAKATLATAWQKLKNGNARFEDLVLQYSEDESSKYRGGDVGYVARDDKRVEQTYGKSFFRKLFSLEAGDYSGVIESNIGLHIIKVTEHQKARILELDDKIAPDNPMTVREYLRAGIFQERQQRVLEKALQEIVAELKNEAEIVKY